MGMAGQLERWKTGRWMGTQAMTMTVAGSITLISGGGNGGFRFNRTIESQTMAIMVP